MTLPRKEPCDDIVPNEKVSAFMDSPVDNSVSTLHSPVSLKLRLSAPQKRKLQELVVHPELDLSVETVDISDTSHPQENKDNRQC